ncbi:Gfo/Idh/MocA family protein [Candidatus Halocynthiibacter alkanivorans]|uniref:Gfo/Idh/MocA family protein n=1 Tax=Candidatus Halocynthiibacter alkanivorans TaxID=2267619 RepID=UPI000DF172AB|nr:Gfo/Idh/MocA family oxidoreductase [Candidatus Halocynthiibacter alkanivorans]
MEKLRIGLIGCGVISDIYLKTCQKFEILEVVACASLDIAESRAKAAQYGIAKYYTPEEIFSDPEIDCVLNLTIPAVHAKVSIAALEAGKHVYSEKPFVTDLADGAKILALAKEKGLCVGNAPDTFLGGRWQTCQKLIEEGVIGAPTGAAAFVGTHGVERHHPNPDFYYQPGGGPLLDLGPYYLTAMIALMGPVKRVCGFSRKTFDTRMIESQPRHGEIMPVDVDTHVSGMLEFCSGAIGSITASFDIWDSETPRLEIYGEKGTLCIPDPDPVHGANNFDGEVWYRTRETSRWSYQPRVQGLENWQVAENTHGYNENSRGLGLVDLAYAVRGSRPVRASGEMAQHVCEIMTGILESPKSGEFWVLNSSCATPAALPEDFPNSEA